MISCSSSKISFSELKGYNHIINTHHRLSNPSVELYLQNLLKKLSCSYKIDLLRSGFLAIYSNQHILLSQKLLCKLESESQLAFVLAHECAHGELKHYSKVYTEEIEMEADKIATQKIQNTKYNLNEAVKSIKLLAELNNSKPRKVPEFERNSEVKLISSSDFKTLKQLCN